MTTPDNWKLFKFAVAKQLVDGSGVREKFLYRADVVATADYDAVLVGSGDREDPLATASNNRFYMFKDFKTGKNATAAPAMTTIGDYSETAECGDRPRGGARWPRSRMTPSPAGTTRC